MIAAAASAPAATGGRRAHPVALLGILVLAASGGILWAVGVNYDGITGSAAQKVHPATYLAMLLFAWEAVRTGNPAAYVARVASLSPAALLLAASGGGFLLHIVLNSGPGMAGALDTFVLPGLMVMILTGRGGRDLPALETLVHAVMLANAVLGLVEFASGHLFFPYRFDGEAFATDRRSAALQGHPLGNATLTACYVLALIGGGGALAGPRRAAMIALQLAALVVFGGRSAIVATLLLGGGFGIAALGRILASGRAPLLGAAAAVLVLAFAPLAIGGLAVAGFFDQLLARFTDDGGSANARALMFDLVASLPLRDLLVGPDVSLVESSRRIIGLEWGIENPIIRLLLYQGAIMTALLTVATALFLIELSRVTRSGTWLPMLAFLFLISSFESLGGKTTLLAKFALLILALYRPIVTEAAIPARR